MDVLFVSHSAHCPSILPELNFNSREIHPWRTFPRAMRLKASRSLLRTRSWRFAWLAHSFIGSVLYAEMVRLERRLSKTLDLPSVSVLICKLSSFSTFQAERLTHPSNAFHVYVNDPTRVSEANHYCAHGDYIQN